MFTIVWVEDLDGVDGGESVKKISSFTGKLFMVFGLILIILTLCGVTYSHWSDNTQIIGRVHMGKWRACVKVWKFLDGAYTDPYTGEDLVEPTNLIAIANENFPTKFKLMIYVKNCGSTELTNVVVTDCIKLNVAPINSTPSKGTVSWEDEAPPGKPGEFVFNYLTWNIGSLVPGEVASLEIWIRTLMNPKGKYEPTSGDEGDSQDIEINEGATVTALSLMNTLSATTEGITILIEDDSVQGNGIGVIATELPYLTPYAEDRYP